MDGLGYGVFAHIYPWTQFHPVSYANRPDWVFWVERRSEPTSRNAERIEASTKSSVIWEMFFKRVRKILRALLKVLPNRANGDNAIWLELKAVFAPWLEVLLLHQLNCLIVTSCSTAYLGNDYSKFQPDIYLCRVPSPKGVEFLRYF